MQNVSTVLLTLVAALAVSSHGLSAEPANESSIDYNRDVRPILSDRCYTCHGPDDNAREADLRLDREQDALYVLSREEPSESELLLRVMSDDPDEQMPPADSKLSLSDTEIDILRRWIEQASPYQQHWSFAPIAAIDVPAVANSDWPRNEIDHFILARLQRAGFEPAAAATRQRLIRRLSFDLTGLAPTLDEIDAFLADDADGAYERLVDRLLAKPAYGERMAVDWLDTARYADTYGYQVDRNRYVWPWRDWVIRAFNRNLPYDQFILSQLAGDLLPDATDEQILATTFNRLHSQKVEGGSVPEEFRVEYVADRNHTFATAFLGLTLECARCHDHKYDPITQKEYYQLFAFFNNIDECGLYSYHTNAIPTPTLRLADDAMKGKIAELDRKVALAEAAVANYKVADQVITDWLRDFEQLEIPGRVAGLDFEKTNLGRNRSVPGKVGNAVQLTGDDGVTLKAGNFRRYQPFSVSLWMNAPDIKQRAVVFHHTAGWTDAGSRGYQLLIEEGHLSWSLIHFWPGNAIRIRTKQPIATDKWLHVVVTNDGSSRADGLNIFVDGRPAAVEVVRDNLTKTIFKKGGKSITIGERNRDRGFTNGRVDEFQVYDRKLTPLEIGKLYAGKTVDNLLRRPEGDFDRQDVAEIAEYYLANHDPGYRQLLDNLQDIRAERCQTIDGIQEIMVMRELPQPRPTFLLNRGAYDAPTDPVTANTPGIFPSLPAGQPHNRLSLAHWLVQPDHPLTARVAVNRVWQMCFGTGIVRTPEDFGSQGSPPTHPLLLDWLAHDFIHNNWDVKRLIKKIVTSATYRQQSTASSDLVRRDPENELLGRGPRYRLPAEMLRDNALALSGLLVDKVGGAPAKPYEVGESFKPVAVDKDQGLYRRSLYTFWKRTAPAPVMMALDASKRDVCSVRRERTSSPLQVFVLLNDPQLIEASRILGQKILQKHGDDTGAMIDETFRLLTSRRPDSDEREVLQRLFREQLEYFKQTPARAKGFLKIGRAKADQQIPAEKLAAAGVLVSTLMNYDECVMKR